MTTLYVPRAGGSTLILQITPPSAPAIPNQLALEMNDGTLDLEMNDGTLPMELNDGTLAMTMDG